MVGINPSLINDGFNERKFAAAGSIPHSWMSKDLVDRLFSRIASTSKTCRCYSFLYYISKLSKVFGLRIYYTSHSWHIF